MSVGDLLGVDEGGELLDLARERWLGWTANETRLRVVDDFDDLRAWLRKADRRAADEVLLVLARLAAPDGGDEIAAAAALAKCLVPGACMEADRVCRLAERGRLGTHLSGPTRRQVDELVASQLWIEVRTFPWRRLTRVASNVLVNTRVAVLRELGDNAQMWRTDRTWANTTLHEAVTRGEAVSDCRRGTGAELPRDAEAAILPGLETDPSASEQLEDLLAWACERQVITEDDRRLLMTLVEEAAYVQTTRIGRGRGGLVGNELSAKVAPLLGVSEATVRRRASRSMTALASAVRARSAESQLIAEAS